MSDWVFIEEAPMDGLARPAEPGLTIGRVDCDIELNDPDVSRRHAVVRKVDSGLALEDLGSTNGTHLNGERIAGIVEIREGDRVRFGNTVWRLAEGMAGSGGETGGAITADEAGGREAAG